MERNYFDSAAAGIAQQCAGRWDSSVTPSDTHGWVCADAIHDWIANEVGLRSPQSIIAELAARMTDAEALSLLHAIGHDKDAVYDPFDKSLDALVTARMIEAAEEIINGPTAQDYAEAAADARNQERWLERRMAGVR